MTVLSARCITNHALAVYTLYRVIFTISFNPFGMEVMTLVLYVSNLLTAWITQG